MANISDVVGAIIPVAALPAIAIGFAMWNADKALSAEGAAVLYKSISETVDDPVNSPIQREILNVLDRYFSYKNGFFRFFRNVFVFTLCSLLAVLCLYTYKTPGLAEQLTSEGFLSQFFGDGFVKTFLVNWFTFSIYSFFLLKITRVSAAQGVALVLLDVILKIVLFTIVTAIIYVAFARSRGAFGGHAKAAIESIPITIQFAARFKDLTAVYLYSMAISSFPIYVVALIKMMATHASLSKAIRGILFFLPFKDKPLRALSMAFGISVGFVALVASLLAEGLIG